MILEYRHQKEYSKAGSAIRIFSSSTFCAALLYYAAPTMISSVVLRIREKIITISYVLRTV